MALKETAIKRASNYTGAAVSTLYRHLANKGKKKATPGRKGLHLDDIDLCVIRRTENKIITVQHRLPTTKIKLASRKDGICCWRSSFARGIEEVGIQMEAM
jgi:hypothetical protein